MKFFDVFISVCSVLASTALAAPGACSGACWTHDPAVIRRESDGTYFRFSTGTKIQIATASAISGPWTIKGSAIPAGSIIDLPGKDDLWAPDIAKVGDLYYLYYSVSQFGSQTSAIGLATSPSMDVGTWTDLGSTGITSKPGSNYNAIDANLIALNEGGYRLTWGSFWGDIYSVAAKNPPKSITGSAVNVAFNPSGTHAVEGPNVFYRSGYYYLFFSAGICCGFDANRPASGEEYKIKVCRSTSASGGFVDKDGVSCTNGGGTVVLQSSGTTYGPGGQGVFTDTKAGGTILYYHYVDTTVGYADGDKKFGWNVLNWSGGWPSV